MSYVAANFSLSLDIGGGHVSAAVIDLTTQKILPESLRRLTTQPDDSVTELIETWGLAALESLAATTPLQHIGIAMPGPFDYEAGISHLQHKFASLYGLNVRDLLRERLGLSVPILFANDAALFALGEWWSGAAKGAKRMIGITLGTGLGSGFIENGLILKHDERIPASGEIWNVRYQTSIAEDFVSASALINAFANVSGKKLNGKAIADLARQGDSSAQQVFTDLGRHLAFVLEPWLKTFQPDCIVLGGNLARALDLFQDSLEAELKGPKCLQSQYFENAALLGAAALKP